MSTLKVNNLQVGQDSTATNNLTWFQPGSPDGSIRLGSGNAGSATTKFTFDKDGNLTCVGNINAASILAPIEGTLDDWIIHAGDTNTKFGFPAADTFTVETAGSERLRIDSSGNLVTGNQTSPTSSDTGNIYLKNGSTVGSVGVALNYATNAVFDSAWKYISNGGASKIIQNASLVSFNFVGSGSAGGGITWGEKLRIDSGGDVTITSADAGSTGPTLKLFHNSASPADNDVVGTLSFRGDDDAGNETEYAAINVKVTDVSNTVEQSHLSFYTRGLTSWNEIFRLNNRSSASAPSYTTDDHNGIILDVYNTGNPYPRYMNFIAKSAGNTDSNIAFWTESVGGSPTEKLRIGSGGQVQAFGALGPGNLPLGGNAANAAIQIRCQSKYQGIAFGENLTHATIGRGANNGALVFVANANPANLGGGAKTTYEWWSGSSGGGGPGKIMGMESDGKLTIGDGNELASSYGANLLLDGGSGSRLTLVGSSAGWGQISFADASTNDATKQAGFIYMDHSSSDNGPRLNMGLDNVSKLHVRNAGSNRGQVEIYGNFNHESTPALEINDGGDARKVYMSNSSGDMAIWTRNASRVGGRLKMNESGYLYYHMQDPTNSASLLKTFQSASYKVASGSTNQSTTYITQYIIAGGYGGSEGMYHGRTNFTVNAANNDHYQPVAFVPMGYNLDDTSFGGHWFGDVWINQSGSQKPSDYGGTNTNWSTMTAQIKWDCAHWNAKPQMSSVVHYVNYGQASIGRLFFSGTQCQFIGWFQPGYYDVQYRVNRGLSVHSATSAGGSILVRHSSNWFTASSMAYSSRNQQFDSAIMYGGNGSHAT